MRAITSRRPVEDEVLIGIYIKHPAGCGRALQKSHQRSVQPIATFMSVQAKQKLKCW